TLGGTNSGAFAINDTSLITGASDTLGSLTEHAFSLPYNGSAGSLTDLDVATGSGLFNSEGQAITKTGDIVGFGSPGHNGNPVDPVLYSNGTAVPLASLGAFCNITMGINDQGDVVGRSSSRCHSGRFPLVLGDATQRAFLIHKCAVYDLNNLITTSGWTIYDAAAINNNGQIAGTGIFNGQYFAIRLDPVPQRPCSQGGKLCFFTVPPCRVLDTRNTGQGPAFGNEDRVVPFTCRCGVPLTAKAVALNVTVTQTTGSGFLTLHADGTSPPGTSTINFQAVQTRANNAVGALSLAGDGTMRVYANISGQSPGVQVILDVAGYFE
ncbi:MAG: hypothetical protein JOZ15_17690, partial [Acidobacteria bacterium]|nr:hypothetical protein [Acidobacteriota bacterium]